MDRWQGPADHFAYFSSLRTRSLIGKDGVVYSSRDIYHCSYVGIDHSGRIEYEMSVYIFTRLLVWTVQEGWTDNYI
jgi:hypothetical protein